MSDTDESNMPDAQESSRDKMMSDLKGEDIFGKYDYTKSKHDSETPESDMEMDEDSQMKTNITNENITGGRRTSRFLWVDS